MARLKDEGLAFRATAIVLFLISHHILVFTQSLRILHE